MIKVFNDSPAMSKNHNFNGASFSISEAKHFNDSICNVE